MQAVSNRVKSYERHNKPGSRGENQRKREARQAGVARECYKLPVGTLSEGAVDTSVLARLAGRVSVESLEFAVESLGVPAVLEREGCPTANQR